MLVALTPRFRREVTALDAAARASVFDVLLGLRLVFTLAADALTLVTVGTHDDVRGFLKSL